MPAVARCPPLPYPPSAHHGTVFISTSTSLEFTIVTDDASATLQVDSGSFTGSWQTLAEGVLQFSDRAYTMNNVPSNLGEWCTEFAAATSTIYSTNVHYLQYQRWHLPATSYLTIRTSTGVLFVNARGG